ncbi:hypothetical protein [Paenibacillus apiarius]|uniref:hypothetical protein n=1 Tax=Paenibacillus apiarius TaxID=46240 RepID=UPI00197FA638|nr:hypothetical protein [Paenibacillus apiarius]MBN3526577.1 hypothetical protein [Paenibacillus apiarius]
MRKKYVKISLAVLLSFAIIAIGYTIYIYRAMEKTAEVMQITFDEAGKIKWIKSIMLMHMAELK